MSSVLRLLGPVVVMAISEGAAHVRAIGGVDKQVGANVEVVLGADTHLDVNVAVALDSLGRRLGVLKVPTTTMGHERLLCWAEGFGPVGCAGIEGTSRWRWLGSCDRPANRG